MIKARKISQASLQKDIEVFWEYSAKKILALQKSEPERSSSPVYTVKGTYTSRGWTEWTQGFEFGSALLQYEATDEKRFLDYGRDKTLTVMAPHLTHTGVHDHGFNNISTYGNLLRMMNEGIIPENEWERETYVTALKCSAAVQAARWTTLRDGTGYIYSFNGPHSLFADTIRSLRSLAVGYQLGHVLMGEHDARISLLDRLIQHIETTAKYNVYYGNGRDSYDERGRTAHESIFNLNDGRYRCPNSQQGYSPFTTWTRGLSWIISGTAEQIEFIDSLEDTELEPWGGKKAVLQMILEPAMATCDFYIHNTPVDGVPYWDTGAPGLAKMDGYLDRPTDPFNDHEPVDSSAAAIAAQGLLRLGRYLQKQGETRTGNHYWNAGLTTSKTLLNEPYLSTKSRHEGLLLHSVYHQPNGWDYIPRGQKVPCGEACMWGDYHIRELALYLQRILNNQPDYCFFTAGI